MPLYKFSARAEKGDTHSPIKCETFRSKTLKPYKIKVSPTDKTDKA
jgi:hypothetical protein